MATHTLFTTSTTAINLNNGDELYIGKNGELVVDSDGITADAAATVEIVVLGSITSFNGEGIDLFNIKGAVVSLGDTANIVGTSLSAVSIRATDYAVLHNAGTLITQSTAVMLSKTVADPGAPIIFSNTGSLQSEGTALVTNSGAAKTSITNSGLIASHHGAVTMHNASATASILNNTGTIQSIRDEAIKVLGTSEIVNSGSITSVKEAAIAVSGDSIISNSGLISGGSGIAIVSLGTMTLTNTGTLVGDVLMGDGNDTYRGKLGEVSGTIYGEGGDDKLRGGDANDEFNGGAGSDLLNGRSGDDILVGGAGSDVMRGGRGDDNLDGGGGDDELSGGRDDDRLAGKAGVDTLTGGKGDDTFVFASASHSGTGSAADSITDFGRGRDMIDLSELSAGTLDFIGTAGFSGSAGEVRYSVGGTGIAKVAIDLDGDGAADMQIKLLDTASLDAGDFVL